MFILATLKSQKNSSSSGLFAGLVFFFAVVVTSAQSRPGKSEVLIKEAHLEELVNTSKGRTRVDAGLSADWLLARWQIENGLSPDAANLLFQAKVKNEIGIAAPHWWKTQAILSLSRDVNGVDPRISSLASRKPFVRVNDHFVNVPSVFENDGRVIYGTANEGVAYIVGTNRKITSDLIVVDIQSSRVRHRIIADEWCPLISPGWIEENLAGTSSPMTWLELTVHESRLVIFGMSENRLFFSVLKLEGLHLIQHFVDIRDSSNLFQFSEQGLRDAKGLGS
ncbi:MAG: hypothetical protein R3C53_26010 [Pirellulaceae bacterium]